MWIKYSRVTCNFCFVAEKMNFLKPGNVPLFSIVRYKRRDCHKLKKPEEKSSIILGKFKESKVFPKPGVSDKAVSLSNARTNILYSNLPFSVPDTRQVGATRHDTDSESGNIWRRWRP